ncbi:hypothetical protein [Bradyrhizobium sp. WSM1417]|uniref:hypothetical protein n=1 Tax=Bradyrhizobium sp. WSM1417 TaxID=754500 RepID=UPI0012EC7DA1|nr:hypothetical protein [Bradyrhizobium sp. WSM1417]
MLKNRADEYDSFVCGIDETSERVDLVMTIFIRTFNERSGVSAADREIRTWKAGLNAPHSKTEQPCWLSDFVLLVLI